MSIERLRKIYHRLPIIRELSRLTLLANTLNDLRMERAFGPAGIERLKKMWQLLQPKTLPGGKKIRIGNARGDGGYVVLTPDRATQAVYSLGVGGEVSFDVSMQQYVDGDIYLYDHTVTKLPKQSSRFHFFPYKIVGTQAEENETSHTLATLIRRNGHEACDNLFLKVDIEGWEWSLFAHLPEKCLRQFSQIVVEFHGLYQVSNPIEAQTIFKALESLNHTHQIIHAHINSNGCKVVVQDVPVLDLLEVTYVRKDGHALSPSMKICHRHWMSMVTVLIFRLRCLADFLWMVERAEQLQTEKTCRWVHGICGLQNSYSTQRK